LTTFFFATFLTNFFFATFFFMATVVTIESAEAAGVAVSGAAAAGIAEATASMPAVPSATSNRAMSFLQEHFKSEPHPHAGTNIFT
jgi:hypothetical protein